MTSRDELLEAAIEAAASAAKAYGDDPKAVRAWSVCHALKAMRSPEVVAQFERLRLEQAGA